ncbi:MAG: signal recognition particle-docking protein FtsY [Xanthomonadaceae bacterium]|nr:signal recognition particle-docking protein FtsY [Xanthomonadaceae bacterium]MDE2245247.1 signal recognition particle-docking protein FtsY [Xanthomonadaceae bacterium]
MFNLWKKKPQEDAARAAAPAAEVGMVEVEASAPPAAARGWRERLAGSGFARGLAGLFNRNARLDDALLDELETTLIGADVGITTATALVEDLRQRMHRREFADADALLDALRAALLALLEPVARPLQPAGARPFVVLVVGVNGVGKTTTIGKLARRWSNEGREVLLAAGDTFRAAAVAQLQAWGARNRVAVISQGQGADAASVIYDALQAARARGADVLIADTAGRLHTQGGLMDELSKIRRVLGKLDPATPHEVLLVIDGTTGQNAISQVRLFREAAGVSGLVVTKLDGSAKGGVVFALAREFGLPIRYVGLGESAADLREFDPQAFVDGLLPTCLRAG